jgi:kynurenine formamidase
MAARYIDVTGTLAPGMWSYRPSIADIPEFEQWRFAEVADRGWEADAFTMATLTGTYFETSKHLYPDQMSIDELPIERCFVSASVARIPKQAREHITAAELERSAHGLQPGDALIVATGWSSRWWESGETFVMESPHFDLRAMEWIVAHKVSMLAGDFPCFDDPQPGGGQGVNTLLFGIGALILAPLVGLDRVTKNRVQLTVLPIKIKGACGAPCRAIITEE